MRVLSAVQPTGSIHIGNYLGTVKNWVALQDKEETIFFIADLHALTIPYKPEELKKNVFDAVVAYIAAGIDPEKSIFFLQSDVKEHTELFWLLSCVCPVGDLKRMSEYKDKAKRFKDNINAGLLNYPVLMAADILLYKAQAVPVGRDQLQHLEIARTIARKFNKRFGQTFEEPGAIIQKTGSKIMALNNPRKKMSKSLGSASYISIFEEPEEITKKIMAAVTDAGRDIKYSPLAKPGISNLLTIYSLLAEKEIKGIEKDFKGKSYRALKKSLAQIAVSSLEPFRRKKKELASREIYVHEMLKKGARRAQIVAQTTLQEVRKKMGLS